ncbi:MAG: hypothetical protein ACYCZ6_18520, partial [Polaromonas sp.]
MENLQNSVKKSATGIWTGAMRSARNRPRRPKTTLLAVTAGSKLQLYHGATHNHCAKLTSRVHLEVRKT